MPGLDQFMEHGFHWFQVGSTRMPGPSNQPKGGKIPAGHRVAGPLVYHHLHALPKALPTSECG